MRRSIIATAFLAVVLLGITFASSNNPEDKGEGVLSVLQKGQAVSIKEAGGRYEIGVMPNIRMLGYQVTEVGHDYVAVEDVGKVTELRIPIYSIRAVSIMKVGKRP